MPIKKKNILSNPARVKGAELIVGIPSLNEADSIGYVVKQVDRGLAKYFPKSKAVIINVDNNSADGTRQVFLEAETKTPKIYLSTPPGVKGKGHNFYNLFSQVIKFRPKAVTVVDADLESITPDWLPALFKPILNGYDLATPYYSRNEYDGPITNHICYPIIYGLLGKNIRQPIGGDFAFSPRLAQYWLKRSWHKTTYKYGIDIFMTLNAILGEFKIAQVGLGTKIHKPSAPKLGPMFSQVVTTLFKNIKHHRGKWFKNNQEQEIPFFGSNNLAKPQPISLDYKGMKATSIFNFHSNEDILEKGLSVRVFRALKKMYDKETIAIDARLWQKIIYDAIYAYDKTDLGAGLIEALKPLYFGRCLTYIKCTLEEPYERCEREIIEQAKLFWRSRGYLIKKYQSAKYNK